MGVVSRLDTTTGLLGQIGSRLQSIIDALFPPDKRATLWARIKEVAVANPKITAFLLTNVVLSGPPLLLFIGFTLTVFIVSLVAALLVALVTALLFTAFMVLVALFVVLPTVFMTTMGATFLFFWGLGGYYIVKWFNEGETPAESGRAVGDTLNSITGGRLTWLMDSAKSSPPTAGARAKDGLLSEDENGLSSKKMSGVTSRSPARGMA